MSYDLKTGVREKVSGVYLSLMMVKNVQNSARNGMRESFAIIAEGFSWPSFDGSQGLRDKYCSEILMIRYAMAYQQYLLLRGSIYRILGDV